MLTVPSVFVSAFPQEEVEIYSYAPISHALSTPLTLPSMSILNPANERSVPLSIAGLPKVDGSYC